jgi:hypothetical protein
MDLPRRIENLTQFRNVNADRQIGHRFWLQAAEADVGADTTLFWWVRVLVFSGFTCQSVYRAERGLMFGE